MKCASCQQPVEIAWVYCPFCGAQERIESEVSKPDVAQCWRNFNEALKKLRRAFRAECPGGDIQMSMAIRDGAAQAAYLKRRKARKKR